MQVPGWYAGSDSGDAEFRCGPGKEGVEFQVSLVSPASPSSASSALFSRVQFLCEPLPPHPRTRHSTRTSPSLKTCTHDLFRPRCVRTRVRPIRSQYRVRCIARACGGHSSGAAGMRSGCHGSSARATFSAQSVSESEPDPDSENPSWYLLSMMGEKGSEGEEGFEGNEGQRRRRR